MIVNVLNSVDPLNYKYLCINMDMPKPQGMIYQTCILGCQLTEGEDNELNINFNLNISLIINQDMENLGHTLYGKIYFHPLSYTCICEA